MRKFLIERSTGELIVLLIAVTVTLMLLIGGISLAILEISNPDTDTSQVLSIISDTINTLIGVMAGFLAGRTEGNTTLPINEREPV